MKAKQITLLFLFLIFFNYLVLAQQKVNEKVPNLKFKQILNYKLPSLKFSDFNGKLIILDFWSFNCASCIEGFPELESLQQEFKDKIQILLVNHENRKQTIDFFKTREKMFKRPDLIFINGDTVLARMFPKDYVPWQVWIDGKQKFRFATQETSEETITSFFNNGKFDGNKLVAHHDFKKKLPLFEQPNKEYAKQIQCITYISKTVPGLYLFGTGLDMQYQPGKARLLIGASNSIEELLVRAFGENFTAYDFVKNNVSLEVSDTFKYRRPDHDTNHLRWEENFSYNYDCILPASKAKQVYRIMQQELVNFFDLDVTIEKRRTKGLALIRTGPDDKLASRGVDKKLEMDNFYSRYNYPFTDFVQDLKIIFRGIPPAVPYSLVDETGYTGKVDIVKLDMAAIAKKQKDFAAFRVELQRFGLDLVEKEYLQDVLVIKEKK